MKVMSINYGNISDKKLEYAVKRRVDIFGEADIDVICVQNLNFNDKSKYKLFDHLISNYTLVCYSRYKSNRFNMIYVTKDSKFKYTIESSSISRIINNSTRIEAIDQSDYTQLTHFEDKTIDIGLGKELIDIDANDPYISRSFCMVYIVKSPSEISGNRRSEITELKDWSKRYNIVCTHFGGDEEEDKHVKEFCKYNIRNLQIANMIDTVNYACGEIIFNYDCFITVFNHRYYIKWYTITQSIR